MNSRETREGRDAPGVRAMEHIRRLAVDIGPRGSCTEEERRGSEYAEAEMRKWGRETTVQPFRCCHTYSLPWGLVGLLMVGTALLLWLCPPGALILATLNLPLYFFLASGRAEVGNLFPQRPSRNVWTKVPARDASGGDRRRVVLLAHVDSTRAALLYAPKQLKSLRFNHMVNLAAVVGLFVIALILWAVTGSPAGGAGAVALGLRVAGAVLGAIALYGVAALVHRETRMPYVHGANDNASGVGVALAVAEAAAAAPLSRTEVWCVVTGAEESGYPSGARRFVDANPAELRDAEILVLDNVGSGCLRHLTAEGIIAPLKMDPGLLELARRLGRARPEWKVRDSICNLGYTDGTPAIAAGLRTLVLWAEGADGLLENYHWPTDTFDRLDPETVFRATTFVLEMIRAIDDDEDRRSGG